jgi:3-methyladenine DNA glycosylase AlkD
MIVQPRIPTPVSDIMNPDIHISQIYTEVVTQLEKLAETESSPTRRTWFEKQHAGSGLQSYGIKTPHVRKVMKRYKNQFLQLSTEEKIDLAKMFYQSNVFEQATVGDTLIELSMTNMSPDQFNLLDEVANYFSNWASVDWICLHGLQSLLLKYPEETLQLLKKWNCSDNTWKKRASVVAFVRKVGSSGEFTDDVLSFCDNLIWDEKDMVKKGVGWALRDNMHGNKEKVLEYVKSLRKKGVSSVVTLYAIEDLKGKERKEILDIKS